MSQEIRGQTEGEKKLSQLLGEYMEEKKKNPEGFLEISTVLMCAGDSKAMDVYMVSKQFGFIKWLMDNDKIDYLKIQLVFKYYYLDVVAYSDYESTLMLLAISDNPIEDLISYLK